MNRAYFAFYNLQRPPDTVVYAPGDAVSRVAPSTVPIVFDFDGSDLYPWNSASQALVNGGVPGYNKFMSTYPVIRRPNDALRIEQFVVIKSSAGLTGASFSLMLFDAQDRTLDFDTGFFLNEIQNGLVDNEPAQLNMLATGYTSSFTFPLYPETPVSIALPFRRHVTSRLRLLGIYSGTFTAPTIGDESGASYAIATFLPPASSPGVIINNPRVYGILIAAGAYVPAASETFLFRGQAVSLK